MSSETFSKEERAAMRERAKEAKQNASKEEALAQVLEKISQMDPADRVLGEKIHDLVLKHAPDLMPKTWYGMQAYAKDGKTVVFFQDAGKFKARYATLGFQDAANLDDGNMWATSFALIKIDPATEKQIVALIKRAAS